MSWVEWFYAGLIIILGASLGSFINVVVYRLPEGLSLLKPPSRCPRCYTRLKAKDNIPVLGWAFLKGKCRYCATPISVRYPLVELITALLFGAAFWKFGLTWAALGAFVFLSFLLALALIDLDLMILPNSLTMWGLIFGVFFKGFYGYSVASAWVGVWNGILDSLLSAFVGLFVFDIVRWLGTKIFKQEAMGGGDPKLAAMMGAWLGWKLMLLSGFLACLIGTGIEGGRVFSGKLGRKQPFPLGPYLVLGAILSLFFGEFLLNWYLSLTGFNS